jgi:hypothetical protein
VLSRCIYLAFVQSSSSEVAQAISGVPVMANVMYMTNCQGAVSSKLPFMFGATLASESYKEDSVFKKIRERAGQWRRTNVLVAGLRQISPAAALPLDENFLQALIERLNSLFTGTKSTEDTGVEECFKDLLEKGTVLRNDTFERSGKHLYMPPHASSLLGRKHIQPVLQPKLEALVRRRYSIQGAARAVEGDAEIQDMIKSLLEFYVTPHIYPKTSSGLLNEAYPLLPGQANDIWKIITDWWALPDNRAAAYAKLQYLVDRFDQHNDPQSESASRFCTEMYPVVGVG